MPNKDTIDYTRMRLNARRGLRTIRRCPKCGRKGEHFTEHLAARNGRPAKQLDHYHHKAQRLRGGYIPLVEIIDSCLVVTVLESNPNE